MNATVTQFSGGVTGVSAPSDMQLVANYVFSLLRGYGLKAQIIANGGSGGGSVSPPIYTGGYQYTELSFIVPEDDLTGVPSNSNYTFQRSDLVGAEQFSGVTVDGTPEYVISGAIQLDNVTGTITRNQPYITGQIVVFSFLKKL